MAIKYPKTYKIIRSRGYSYLEDSSGKLIAKIETKYEKEFAKVIEYRGKPYPHIHYSTRKITINGKRFRV